MSEHHRICWPRPARLPLYKRIYYILQPSWLSRLIMSISTFFFMRRIKKHRIPMIKSIAPQMIELSENSMKSTVPNDLFEMKPMEFNESNTFHLEFIYPKKRSILQKIKDEIASEKKYKQEKHNESSI